MYKKFEKHYKLKQPCGNCPFRNDNSAIELADGRLQGIVDGLTEDDFSTFHCHKTTQGSRGGEWVDDGDEQEYVASGHESMCAGAAIYLLKVGRPTVGMRVANAMGALKFEDYAQAMASVVDLIDNK